MLWPVSRPYSEACEQNRAPLLAVLRPRLEGCRQLLEIGSGTGQHAVYFAPELPHLIWQTSDRAAYHPGIQAWLATFPVPNVLPPLALDVTQDAWPTVRYDAVFSANTAHIMSEQDVQAMFSGVGRVLEPHGRFLLYGPFNIGGCHTAPSNQRFDQYLRRQDPRMGVRDLEWLAELAAVAGMRLEETVDMPADNKTLCWRRS